MNTKNILFGVLLVVALGAGFVGGRFTAPTNNSTLPEVLSDVVSEVIPNSETNSNTATEADTSATEGSSVNSESNTAVTNKPAVTPSKTTTAVTAPAMTDSQRKMLTSFGLDPDKITITAEMVVCAETKIGASRIEEIKNGATPSFLEGAALLACYSQ